MYTATIRITIRLPSVSRCFCGSIRVRGRWSSQCMTSFEINVCCAGARERESKRERERETDRQIESCNPKCLAQGPKMANLQQRSGEGANGIWPERTKSLFTSAKGVAFMEKQLSDGARDSWETLALWAPQNSFAPSPHHSWELIALGSYPFSTPLQGLDG